MLKNELLKPTVTRPSHNYIHSEIFLPETNIHILTRAIFTRNSRILTRDIHIRTKNIYILAY
jgi:hypothetical protein